MTIKGSFILEHPYVKAVFSCKKTKSSQNRSPKWQFFKKFKGPNIKYSHHNFCEDRLRAFGVARGRILAFSIDLLRRL